MTGPEHYRKAEQHLEYAAENEAGSDAERWNLGAAQVHATLALAAATALAHRDVDHVLPTRDASAWFRVAGTPKPETKADAS